MKPIATTAAAWVIVALLTLLPEASSADLVPVDRLEGQMHGFLALKSTGGKLLADGEVTQVADTDKVTAHLVFKFKDGSLYDDTTVYSQHGQFRLISDHRIERGPSFKHFIETSIDMRRGLVEVHDGEGKYKSISRHMNLPPDLATGIFMMLVDHLHPDTKQISVPFLSTSPEPRLVDFVITRGAEETVRHGMLTAKLVSYVVKVKIPGIAGALAPLVGKQPQDMRIWVTDGPAPTFVRFEGPLYFQGPVWQIEMTPVTPAPQSAAR